MFFRMNTVTLGVVLFLIVGGAVTAGAVIGRRIRERPGVAHEPVGVVQGALLALVGLLLAFGLTMAVGRYDTRRALVVHEADTIGTTYLTTRTSLVVGAKMLSSRSRTAIITTGKMTTPTSQGVVQGSHLNLMKISQTKNE